MPQLVSVLTINVDMCSAGLGEETVKSQWHSSVHEGKLQRIKFSFADLKHIFHVTLRAQSLDS